MDTAGNAQRMEGQEMREELDDKRRGGGDFQPDVRWTLFTQGVKFSEVKWLQLCHPLGSSVMIGPKSHFGIQLVPLTPQ